MADVHTKQQRSYNMSRVRASGNKSTELRMIALLTDLHIKGWRRRFRLYGRPDFVFPACRVAVFVDGCFWHVCPKGCKPAPTKSAFWKDKLRQNKIRDRKVNGKLRQMGWKVVRIWEHELKKPSKVCLKRTSNAFAFRPTSSVRGLRRPS